jgi:uncharacterized membrane protein
MDRRTGAIIAVAVTALLCGCPGLVLLFAGFLSGVISFIPGAEINIFGSTDPRAALTTGIGMLCVGVLLIAIPFVIGFAMLRNRPAQVEVIDHDEPLPPPG